MIYPTLREHQRLANKRHPMYEKNRYARFFSLFFIGISILYLIFVGYFLSTLINSTEPYTEPVLLFNKFLLYYLMVDFHIRFIYQRIPVQEIKPYLLLPIYKKKLIQFFLYRSAIYPYNFFWFALLIPFALKAILPIYGWGQVAGFLMGYWLIILINNYWYLLCRTLVNERFAYLLLPLGIFGLIIAADLLFPHSITHQFSIELGNGLMQWNLFYWGALIVVLLIMYGINYKMQMVAIYKEIAKVDNHQLKHVSEYRFLDRWGEIGEYIRLEIKLRTRNKFMRAQFRKGLILMFAFSMMLSFSNFYDDSFMKNFICIYNFAALGDITLIQIMSAEGNYLDGLISRKESILSLLKAKYYFNTALLIIPLLLCIPAIATGKITWLTALSYLFMTSGIVFFTLFQLAVYNNQTVPLDTNVTGKNTGSTSYQRLLTLLSFLLPILLNTLFCNIWGETLGQTLLLIIGVLLMLTHNWWLKNIYKRFMQRRYINLDGFRNSR